MERVGELLARQRKHVVPSYQRNYSWTEDQIEALWKDITEALEEGRPEYFLGAVVFKQVEADHQYEVIDGQQRLTTILMLLAGIREVYRASQDDRADDVQKTYFGTRDRRTKAVIPNFEMNVVNNSTFMNYVVEQKTTDEIKAALKANDLDPSNKLMLNAMLFIWDLLTEKMEQLYGPGAFDPDFLIRLEDYLKTNVTIILLTVSDEADAFTVFETLNDRGLELSVLDLLKNRVFGKAGSGQISTAKHIWSGMTANLDGVDGVRFLRHFWVSRNGRIQTKNLYRAMRDKITDAKSAISFVEELRDNARLYAALGMADHPVWDEYSNSTRQAIGELKLLGALQCYPVLLAALQRMDAENVEKVARIMLVMAVRYSLICQYRTGIIENRYADIAQGIHNGTHKKAAAVFRALQDLYPADDRFKDALKYREISNSGVARWVLASINQYYQGETELQVVGDVAKVNLEHILPRNPSQDWYAPFKAQGAKVDDYIYLIGNLALTEKVVNRKVGNAAFAAKRMHVYEESKIATTNYLSKFDQWGPIEILERQMWLAEGATKVWKYSID